MEQLSSLAVESGQELDGLVGGEDGADYLEEEVLVEAVGAVAADLERHIEIN